MLSKRFACMAGSTALAITLLIGVSGCAQDGPVLDADGHADQDFVEAVANGLESRWEITDSVENRGETITEEDMAKAIQQELDAVADYSDVKFENDELGDYADQYIAALSDMDANDYFEMNEKWSIAYSQRTAALFGINSISPIPVEERNQDTLDALVSDGEAALEAQNIISSANFVQEEPKYEGETYHTYSTVIENQSDVTFSFFQLDISLVDQDGVVVETQTAYTDNWAPGGKHRFEFMSDAEFSEIRVETASWSI